MGYRPLARYQRGALWVVEVKQEEEEGGSAARNQRAAPVFVRTCFKLNSGVGVPVPTDATRLRRATNGGQQRRRIARGPRIPYFVLKYMLTIK
jgi:hypothetical protein